MEKKELKIISLNTWGGRVDGILDFFEKNVDVDIFCLQEIIEVKDKDLKDNDFTRENKKENKNQDLKLFTNLKKVLPNYNSFFRPHFKDHFGLAIFVKRDLEIFEEEDVFVFGTKEDLNMGTHGRNIHFIKLNINNKNINICNFHGLWTGGGKDDTDHRIKQSENIIELFKTLEGEIVLCGDFNLNPDTLSIKMIEDFGLRNLIKENNITSTRTSLYKKENRFADYTFVSKYVEVKSFEMMPDEISDHSPMKLVIKI